VRQRIADRPPTAATVPISIRWCGDKSNDHQQTAMAASSALENRHTLTVLILVDLAAGVRCARISARKLVPGRPSRHSSGCRPAPPVSFAAARKSTSPSCRWWWAMRWWCGRARRFGRRYSPIRTGGGGRVDGHRWTDTGHQTRRRHGHRRHHQLHGLAAGARHQGRRGSIGL